MDTCQIFRGRTWLYDSDVMHNEFLNTYSLFKGGNKIALVPLAPSKIQKNKPQKNPDHSDLLLTCSEPL